MEMRNDFVGHAGVPSGADEQNAKAPACYAIRSLLSNRCKGLSLDMRRWVFQFLRINQHHPPFSLIGGLDYCFGADHVSHPHDCCRTVWEVDAQINARRKCKPLWVPRLAKDRQFSAAQS